MPSNTPSERCQTQDSPDPVRGFQALISDLRDLLERYDERGLRPALTDDAAEPPDPPVEASGKPGAECDVSNGDATGSDGSNGDSGEPELIKTIELAEILGIHVQVVRDKHAQGLLPQCASISTRYSLWWSRTSIKKWIDEGCPIPPRSKNRRGKFR